MQVKRHKKIQQRRYEAISLFSEKTGWVCVSVSLLEASEEAGRKSVYVYTSGN
jgi:hypothetical protein